MKKQALTKQEKKLLYMILYDLVTKGHVNLPFGYGYHQACYKILKKFSKQPMPSFRKYIEEIVRKEMQRIAKKM